MGTFINLYGAPGSGKSVKAAELMAGLRKAGKSCEIVSEVAKEYTYDNKPIQGHDQLFIFSEQLKREQQIERSGVDFIVCESPLLLVSFYALYHNCPVMIEIDFMAKKIEAHRLNINIFIKRNVEYDVKNRFETSEQSNEIAFEMLNYLGRKIDIQFQTRTTHHIDNILLEIL